MNDLNRRLLGVVLCGGQSLRMGQDKADLPHPDGSTFLQHAVERLRSVTDGVAISASSARSIEMLHNVAKIEDPIAHRGPMVGVAAALSYASEQGFAGCLFTPVDAPDLSASELQHLKNAWRGSNQLTCGVHPLSGQMEPIIAIYPTDFAASLNLAARSHDRSLHRWLEGQDPHRVKLSLGACRNINMPEDL